MDQNDRRARQAVPALRAGTTLAGTPLGEAGFGPAHGVGGGAPLPFAAATALLIGITVILATIAARTTVRRDIA